MANKSHTETVHVLTELFCSNQWRRDCKHVPENTRDQALCIRLALALAASVRRMGRPGKVAFLLALFVFLGTLQGTRAQYDEDDYGYEDYDESDYDYDDEESDALEDEEYQEEAEASGDAGDGEEGTSPPMAVPRNQEFTPMCNNENCWIRVDWEPPARDTWMSCLLDYRIGLREPGEDWIWFQAEGTFRDLRSGQQYFYDEAEGTNHSLTIRNLHFATNYEVVIKVLNPYGEDMHMYEVATPPGLCTKVCMHCPFQCKSLRALPGRVCS